MGSGKNDYEITANGAHIDEKPQNDYEITVKGSILIKSYNPNMNKQLTTNGTSYMLKIFSIVKFFGLWLYVILIST